MKTYLTVITSILLTHVGTAETMKTQISAIVTEQLERKLDHERLDLSNQLMSRNQVRTEDQMKHQLMAQMHQNTNDCDPSQSSCSMKHQDPTLTQAHPCQ